MTQVLLSKVFFVLLGAGQTFGPASFDDPVGDAEHDFLDWRSGVLGLNPEFVWATLNLNGNLEFEGTLYYCFLKLHRAEPPDGVYVMQLRQGTFEAHYVPAGGTMVPVPHNESFAMGDQIQFRASRRDSGLPFASLALICRAQLYPEREGAIADDISFSQASPGVNANSSGPSAGIPALKLPGSLMGAGIACVVARATLVARDSGRSRTRRRCARRSGGRHLMAARLQRRFSGGPPARRPPIRKTATCSDRRVAR